MTQIGSAYDLLLTGRYANMNQDPSRHFATPQVPRIQTPQEAYKGRKDVFPSQDASNPNNDQRPRQDYKPRKGNLVDVTA